MYIIYIVFGVVTGGAGEGGGYPPLKKKYIYIFEA